MIVVDVTAHARQGVGDGAIGVDALDGDDYYWLRCAIAATKSFPFLNRWMIPSVACPMSHCNEKGERKEVLEK